MDGFTNVKYNTAADVFLERVELAIDALDNKRVEDVMCSGGVLSMEIAGVGTFLLNKQAPNMQIWLSSPLSGPHHYNMVTDESVTAHDCTSQYKENESESNGVVDCAESNAVRWCSDHDGHDLRQRLRDELSQALQMEIRL